MQPATRRRSLLQRMLLAANDTANVQLQLAGTTSAAALSINSNLANVVVNGNLQVRSPPYMLVHVLCMALPPQARSALSNICAARFYSTFNCSSSESGDRMESRKRKEGMHWTISLCGEEFMVCRVR